MRSPLLRYALLVALAGCQAMKVPATSERQASLAPSGLVALPDLALDLELNYRGAHGGIVELSFPPDAVFLVRGDRMARVNGRPVSMDHPMVEMGEDYALYAPDAARLRDALRDSRKSRPAPSITLPAPAPPERSTFPAAWLPLAAERRWTHVIIHHTATPAGNAVIINKMHLSQGWENGLGYDFLVGNGTQSADGEVEVSRRWRDQLVGAHTKVAGDVSNRWNEIGIGVCLVGDFTRTRPTGRQMDALARVVRALQERYDIRTEKVIGHSHVDATECPGPHFPWDELRRRLR